MRKMVLCLFVLLLVLCGCSNNATEVEVEEEVLYNEIPDVIDTSYYNEISIPVLEYQYDGKIDDSIEAFKYICSNSHYINPYINNNVSNYLSDLFYAKEELGKSDYIETVRIVDPLLNSNSETRYVGCSVYLDEIYFKIIELLGANDSENTLYIKQYEIKLTNNELIDDNHMTIYTINYEDIENGKFNCYFENLEFESSDDFPSNVDEYLNNKNYKLLFKDNSMRILDERYTMKTEDSLFVRGKGCIEDGKYIMLPYQTEFDKDFVYIDDLKNIISSSLSNNKNYLLFTLENSKIKEINNHGTNEGLLPNSKYFHFGYTAYSSGTEELLIYKLDNQKLFAYQNVFNLDFEDINCAVCININSPLLEGYDFD